MFNIGQKNHLHMKLNGKNSKSSWNTTAQLEVKKKRSELYLEISEKTTDY